MADPTRSIRRRIGDAANQAGRSSLPCLASTAAGHMHMIADPLADTIVKQFPDRFGG